MVVVETLDHDLYIVLYSPGGEVLYVISEIASIIQKFRHHVGIHTVCIEYSYMVVITFSIP